MERIGFIGLGIMGRPMAKNLLSSGTQITVFDVNQQSVAEMRDCGAEVSSPATIGGSCDIIFMILPDGNTVSDVLFGDNGVAATVCPGTLVVDMSSVTPNESKNCAKRLGALGASFMDCPVSGGEPKALDGTLAFMCGGSVDDYTRTKPYLDIMGDSHTLVGDIGAGSVAKLANQIIVNMTIAAISEALTLATKAGVDPEAVYNAIRGGLAGSTVLDAKAPMMLRRDFKPGGKVSVNHKDIRNVMNSAHELDVPLPLTAQLFEIFQCLKVAGKMNEDHSSIVKFYETIAGVEVRGG